MILSRADAGPAEAASARRCEPWPANAGRDAAPGNGRPSDVALALSAIREAGHFIRSVDENAGPVRSRVFSLVQHAAIQVRAAEHRAKAAEPRAEIAEAQAREALIRARESEAWLADIFAAAGA